MADKEPTTTQPPAKDKEPAATAVLTKAALAKLAKGIKVRVFDLDKEGQPKVDPETRQKLVVVRDITATDIISHREDGDQVVIVTVDGQKIRVAA